MVSKNTVKQVASLKMQKYRKETGLFVVEGRKMVEELLHSDFTMESLYATETFIAQHPHFVAAETVSESQMAQMSSHDTPSGLLAVARIPTGTRLSDSAPLVLALDGIANPGNMGTIIRTAEWFGINDIACSPDCVELWNPKVIQATMGSVFRIRLIYKDLPSFLNEKRQQGKAIMGALLEGKNLFEQRDKAQGVIVIGSESHGIRPEVLPYLTHPITIPRASGSATESLNAAVAAAIIMAELTR